MNTNIALSTLALATTLALTSGCATIVRGANDDLVITSSPPGAEVTLSTGQVGVTPATFSLSRIGGFDVRLKKEGYRDASARITPKLSGEGFAFGMGNLVAGGIVGAVVDGATGAAYDLRPNPLHVTLVKTSQPAAIDLAAQ